jgi:hypothetical protein
MNRRSKVLERQLVPGRPAVIALPAALGRLHLAQQRVHLGNRQRAIGAHRPWQAMVDRSSSRRDAMACVPPNSRMSCSTARRKRAGSASVSGAGTPRTASVEGPSADIAKPSVCERLAVFLHRRDLQRLGGERRRHQQRLHRQARVVRVFSRS